jgi:hypothetical protein
LPLWDIGIQFDAVGVVDDAVEDGIGDGGLADHLIGHTPSGLPSDVKIA